MPRKTSSRKPAAKPAKKTGKPGNGKVSARTKQAMVTPARQIRPGYISHTEFASNDPAATKAWAAEVLGWEFLPSMPTPQGDYHMWSFGDNQGGGIRGTSGPEPAGAVPYVEVKDIKAAYAKALKAGAKEMMAPEAIPGGMGAIAVVQAPGGPAIGFWSNRL